jgi:serine/threonine protein phosphatase PrpC
MTEFAIIATDGLWDVLSPQAAVNFVRKQLGRPDQKSSSKYEVDFHEVAVRLVKEALARGSVDNVTALIVAFRN